MAKLVTLKTDLNLNGKYQLEMLVGDHVVASTKPIFESIENANQFGMSAMKSVWPDVEVVILSDK